MIEQSTESPYIHAVTADNFQSMVLENSRQGPVLVNFWSRKAGPCLRQYPILDKLIYDLQGKLLLTNIDTDEDYRITNEYGITSVPTLKLFLHEQVVETLHGLQSEEDLNTLLQQYVVRPSDNVLAEAVRQYSLEMREKAYEMITEAIIDDPVNPRLPLAMCKMLKHEGRFTEADKVLSSLPEQVSQNPQVIKLGHLIKFHLISAEADETEVLLEKLEQHPDDLAVRRQLSAQYVIQQDFEEAIIQLAKIMETDKNLEEQYPRKALLWIFAILDREHELVKRYRYLLNQYSC